MNIHDFIFLVGLGVTILLTGFILICAFVLMYAGAVCFVT